MSKKIVLITTGQPSCNPRIVKEADALHTAGYDVTLVYCFFINWASETDNILLDKVSWKYQMVGGSPKKNKMLYFFTRVKFKIANLLSPLFGNYFSLFERAQARCYDEMLDAAKKLKADWYIGHNLGALSIAVRAATYRGAKAGFDFEDYYTGENTFSASKILKRIHNLENKYIYLLSYYSAASDLIKDAVQRDHPSFEGQIITLNNSFPVGQQPPILHQKKESDKTLQLFWFSQTVGNNRGLKQVIESIKCLNNPLVHLTLAGNCKPKMRSFMLAQLSELKDNIHFVGIIQPEDLPSYSSKFDIGLALEPGFSQNNDIALSNKIFTYLLGGNAIIMSKTSMQLTFNQQYHVGESIDINNIKELAKKINGYFDFKKLNEQKKHNYDLAKYQLNWNVESKKLLSIFN